MVPIDPQGRYCMFDKKWALTFGMGHFFWSFFFYDGFLIGTVDD
jgi:hypothetical protein